MGNFNNFTGFRDQNHHALRGIKDLPGDAVFYKYKCIIGYFKYKINSGDIMSIKFLTAVCRTFKYQHAIIYFVYLHKRDLCSMIMFALMLIFILLWTIKLKITTDPFKYSRY